MKTDSYCEADVVIVGGGIAGCTLAMALATSYKVIVIDKLQEPAERIGECLAPAARRILRKLNLLQGITDYNTVAGLYLPNLGTRSYWGSNTQQIVDHLRNPDGLGWHLNRKAFEMHLRKETAARGVQCCWNTRLSSVAFEQMQWRLKVKSSAETSDESVSCIKAKFVVDASGRLSAFARLLGVKRDHFDKLIAHWAIVPDQEAAQMSIISAAETGWWYTASLPDNKRVVAMHTDPDLVEKHSTKDADWFLEAAKMNEAMASVLTTVDALDYCGVVAANSTRLQQVAGPQWAAVGDAAMSFDPLSSQGMFNAMAGAVQLAALILAPGQNALDDPREGERIATLYSRQMDSIWERYTAHKALFYTQEQRWQKAPFWSRRNSQISAIGR